MSETMTVREFVNKVGDFPVAPILGLILAFFVFFTIISIMRWILSE